MKKKFEFEFTDNSSENAISFEYDEDDEDQIEIRMAANGIPTLYANSQALLVLAKTFIKMAMCDYQDGFYVSFRKDHDADESEIMYCVIKK